MSFWEYNYVTSLSCNFHLCMIVFCIPYYFVVYNKDLLLLLLILFYSNTLYCVLQDTDVSIRRHLGGPGVPSRDCRQAHPDQAGWLSAHQSAPGQEPADHY